MAWLGALLLAGSVSRLAAQEIGDPAAGRQLAETWCSTCHIVTPTPQSAASTGAPTFSAIARMSSTTPLFLRALLQTPHAQMPDLHLSRDESTTSRSHFLSLRRQ